MYYILLWIFNDIVTAITSFLDVWHSRTKLRHKYVEEQESHISKMMTMAFNAHLFKKHLNWFKYIALPFFTDAVFTPSNNVLSTLLYLIRVFAHGFVSARNISLYYYAVYSCSIDNISLLIHWFNQQNCSQSFKSVEVRSMQKIHRCRGAWYRTPVRNSIITCGWLLFMWKNTDWLVINSSTEINKNLIPYGIGEIQENIQSVLSHTYDCHTLNRSVCYNHLVLLQW